MTTAHYILDAERHVIEVDLFTWAQWFGEATETGERVVAQTQIRAGAYVSTVFLGLDHRFHGDGPPIVFESMAFTAREVWRPGLDEREAREQETALGGPVPRFITEGRYTLGDELDCRRCATWNEAVMQHEEMVERLAAAREKPSGG